MRKFVISLSVIALVFMSMGVVNLTNELNIASDDGDIKLPEDMDPVVGSLDNEEINIEINA